MSSTHSAPASIDSLVSAVEANTQRFQQHVSSLRSLRAELADAYAEIARLKAQNKELEARFAEKSSMPSRARVE